LNKQFSLKSSEMLNKLKLWTEEWNLSNINSEQLKHKMLIKAPVIMLLNQRNKHLMVQLMKLYAV